MDQARWQRLEELFSAALEQPPLARAGYLAGACGTDVELRTAIERLLEDHDQGDGFLECPEPIASKDPEPASAQMGMASGHFAAPSRFELRSRLGTGGFGDVFEVFDRERQSLMALKDLRRVSPEQFYRIKREFRTLAGLRHPNVVHVYELYSSEDPPFFTMELLRGCDLSQVLRNRATGAERVDALLRRQLVDLCHGIEALHEAGLIHRDIKPTNVFVRTDGRVVLLDFGLVKPIDETEDVITRDLIGTPQFLAPEQIRRERLTVATDWYSFGVLLYLALTGRYPFERDPLDLAGRLESVPLAPSSLGGSVFPELDTLCLRLLDPDPLRRPAGADIRRTLQPGAVAAQVNGPSRPLSRPFVHRDSQLSTLRAAFDTSERTMATALVHVRGESGVGKTALVRRFLAQLREQRSQVVILSGRCYESELATHKGLDELVDQLARFFKMLPSADRDKILPRDFPLLAQLFPILAEFEPSGRGVLELPDPRERRHRALACFGECLARISEGRPLVLWLDDLQWCDIGTVQVLEDLILRPSRFQCFVVASYRDNDVDQSPHLKGLYELSAAAGGQHEVQLHNLAMEEARGLALALLSSDPTSADTPAIASAIATESRGNPYFVGELVRYASQPSASRDMTAGVFGIGHVIKRRVGVLPESSIRLLELVAVAGGPLTASVCDLAAGLREHALEARGILTREHLLRVRPSVAGDEYDVYHDQIREAIAGHLSAEAKRVYHALIAKGLEAAQPTDYERLASHYDASGQTSTAARFLRLAAADATATLAFERAARLYRRLLDLEGEERGSGPALQEQLADALSNAGRGREAAEVYLAASAAAASEHALELRRKACEQYLRSGHFSEGMHLIRRLLVDVGVRYPATDWMVPVSVLWSRVLLRLNMRWSNWDAHRQISAKERLRLDICWTVTVGMCMVDVLRSVDFQARYTVLALQSGDPARLALGLAGEVAGGAIDGRRSDEETSRLHDRAVRLATEANNQHALAFAASMRGVASWFTGEWSDCYERNRAAAELYRERCSGVAWELTTANSFALSSLALLGRWREHKERLPSLVREAGARGDRYGAVSLPLLVYVYLSDLAADRAVDARSGISRSLAAWPETEFQLPHCDALIGQVESHLYEGDAQAAEALLDDAWPKIKRSHLLEIQFYRVLLTTLRGRTRIGVAMRVRNSDAGAARRLLARARSDAKRVAATKSKWALALSDLLSAGIFSVDGHSSAARDRLLSALAVFSACRMEQDMAVCRRRLWELDPSEEEARQLSQAWLDREAVVDPPRVAEMLAPGSWE